MVIGLRQREAMANANYYNAIASVYDQARWMTEPIAEDVADVIAALVGATPNTAFLEPGVGTGLNVLPLVKRGYAVTGIDISQEMLDQFRQKLQPMPPNLTLVQADSSVLPFPDASFDVVLTVHMIHTVSDWQMFLDDVGRVLKPQGCYVNAQWVTPPARKAFAAQFKAILANYRETNVPSCLDNRIEDIDNYFQANGYRANYRVAKQWTVTDTVADLLSYYRSRAYGFCWWVPDDVFDLALAEFEAFCADHYPSLTTQLSSTAQFELWAYTANP